MGIVEFVVAFAGFVIACGVVYQKVVKPLLAFLKRAHDMYEVLGQVEKNSRQLTNNGGSHMKDAVDRIESKLDDHIEQSAVKEKEIRDQIFYALVARQSGVERIMPYEQRG